MPDFFERIRRSLVMAFCCVPMLAHTTPLKITFATPMLAGVTAQIAFDFIDGGNPDNTVTLTQFMPVGALGRSSTIGDVSGSLPGLVELRDTAFFNEYLTEITLGTRFSFLFESTGNDSGLESIPDAFSVFLLDPITGLPLLATNDPTGADAFLRISIMSPIGVVTKFQDHEGKVSVHLAPATEMDEPAFALLLMLGLITLTIGRWGFNRRPVT